MHTIVLPAYFPMTHDPDTETLRKLDDLQEKHRCPTCGKRPRLQTSLPTDWIETAEVDVTLVKACDCPVQPTAA